MHNTGWRICFWRESHDKATRRRICIPLPPLDVIRWPPRTIHSEASPGDPSPWRAFELDGLTPQSVDQLTTLAVVDQLARRLSASQREAVQSVVRRLAQSLNERDIGGELHCD